MDSLRQFLQEKGLKYTRQREAVWSAFQKLKDLHPSSEEIYRQSKKINPRLSLATVYRSLKWMKEGGIIQERNFGNGFHRYEMSRKRPVHAHLICYRCGRVIEIEEGIEAFWEKRSKKYKFHFLRGHIEGHGVCQNCQSGWFSGLSGIRNPSLFGSKPRDAIQKFA